MSKLTKNDIFNVLTLNLLSSASKIISVDHVKRIRNGYVVVFTQVNVGLHAQQFSEQRVAFISSSSRVLWNMIA